MLNSLTELIAGRTINIKIVRQNRSKFRAKKGRVKQAHSIDY
jgi:hypothetical protein